MHIAQNILDAVNEWLTPTFDNETQVAIKELMTTSPKDLEESFYKNLEFGTGGMRGVMGVGNNRINKYTLGKSTQGLSDYLKIAFPNQPLKAVIAFKRVQNYCKFLNLPNFSMKKFTLLTFI